MGAGLKSFLLKAHEQKSAIPVRNKNRKRSAAAILRPSEAEANNSVSERERFHRGHRPFFRGRLLFLGVNVFPLMSSISVKFNFKVD